MTAIFSPQSRPTLYDSLVALSERLTAEPETITESRPLWQPIPGSPQEAAYNSPANVIGMGGAGGGGKTDLQYGFAATKHKRSRIFRRYYTDLDQLIERGNEIQAGRCRFVYGEKRRWDTPDGRIIRLSAIEHERDLTKFAGRPSDFLGFDEAAEFSEYAFRFLSGWLRTEDPEQTCRILLTFNPPRDEAGQWIVRYFAPWLDDTHPNPAQPGELRWFVRLDDEDVEVEGENDVRVDGNGETIRPQSRTFYPARVEDNPYYMATGYADQLNSLPEPLRSQLRYGDFTIGVIDDPWQVIPTAWVLEAQERWRNTPKPQVTMRAAGVDVARGGKDTTAIASLFGAWFDEVITHAGSATPDGATVARYVTDVVPPMVTTFIDVIGYGASAYDHLNVMPNTTVHPVNNAAAASKGSTDKSGRYGFANVRAESYWKLREALDPDSGENICLPPDRDLRIQLCAPHYKIVGGRIQIEPKDAIIARSGSSPDKADAVVMAWLATLNKPVNLLDIVVI